MNYTDIYTACLPNSFSELLFITAMDIIKLYFELILGHN